MLVITPENKFPAFYESEAFITMLTGIYQLALSWDKWMQSMPSHPMSLNIHFNIIILSTARFPSQNIVYTSYTDNLKCLLDKSHHTW